MSEFKRFRKAESLKRNSAQRGISVKILARWDGEGVHLGRRSGTGLWRRIKWCRRGESNPRPRDYETLALPLSYAGLSAILYATNEPPKVSSFGWPLKGCRNAGFDLS